MSKKKSIVTVLVISYILSIANPSYADVNTSQKYQGAVSNTTEQTDTSSLTDISNHWAKANIQKLVALKAINGYEDGTFKPDQTITRAEFLKIAMLAVEPTLDTKSDEGSHWCSGILKIAYDKQVLYDYELSSSSEALDQPITRNEMARILVRINELIQKESDVSVAGIENLLTDYQAYSTSSSEYLPYVAKAYMKGVLSGYGDGSFQGKKQGTRSEATTMILRLLDKSSRVAVDMTKLQTVTNITNARGQLVQTEVKKYCYQAFSQTKIYNQDGKYYISINFPSLPSGFLWYPRISCLTKESIVIYESDVENPIIGPTGSNVYELPGLTADQVKNGAIVSCILEIVQAVDERATTCSYAIGTDKPAQIYEFSTEISSDVWLDYDTSNIFTHF